ncbi:MAG: hypothetical protein FJX76_12430 [Armatimonadetes bacterium]|nr:hypothetical protein [Armatimonadota bacterium]
MRFRWTRLCFAGILVVALSSPGWCPISGQGTDQKLHVPAPTSTWAPPQGEQAVQPTLPRFDGMTQPGAAASTSGASGGTSGTTPESPDPTATATTTTPDPTTIGTPTVGPETSTPPSTSTQGETNNPGASPTNTAPTASAPVPAAVQPHIPEAAELEARGNAPASIGPVASGTQPGAKRNVLNPAAPQTPPGLMELAARGVLGLCLITGAGLLLMYLRFRKQRKPVRPPPKF